MVSAIHFLPPITVLASSYNSGSTVFRCETAASSGTLMTRFPSSPTILAEFPVLYQLDGSDPEAGCEHAVIGSR